MNLHLGLPNTTKILLAFVGAFIILLAASVPADAIYFINPEGPDGAHLSLTQWADMGGCSLPLMPRSAVAPQLILHSPPDQDIAWTYNFGNIIEGWFRAVAEAGAIGGIPR